MCHKAFAGIFLSAALLAAVAGAQAAPDQSAPATQPTTQPVIDLHNTVCPVSGDSVGDSKLTVTYEGKIYHFCCDSCPVDFNKDPAKYAKAVAADPKKYGIKKSD